ncbi:MAG: hypothetical protein MZV70_45990 [Desulfobacterales bacterium]|nr:hypothetical protein [Desulfobacterales bacterium]
MLRLLAGTGAAAGRLRRLGSERQPIRRSSARRSSAPAEAPSRPAQAAALSGTRRLGSGAHAGAGGQRQAAGRCRAVATCARRSRRRPRRRRARRAAGSCRRQRSPSRSGRVRGDPAASAGT